MLAKNNEYKIRGPKINQCNFSKKLQRERDLQSKHTKYKRKTQKYCTQGLKIP